HLRGYLDFAERGLPAVAVSLPTDSQGDAESPFEEEVLRVLRSWGYVAVPQVGHAGFRIDIGIKAESDQGGYVLGVECDGDMYHRSKTARDRDRLRQEVLEGLGWTIFRIWGSSWYRQRFKAEADLRRAVERALSGGASSVRPRVMPATVEPNVGYEEVDLDA